MDHLVGVMIDIRPAVLGLHIRFALVEIDGALAVV